MNSFISKNKTLLIIGAFLLLLIFTKIGRAFKAIIGTFTGTAEGVESAIGAVTGASQKADSEANLNALQTNVNSAYVNKANLHKALSYYSSMSETLYTSMEHWQPASFTLPESIYTELSKLNKDELVQIYKDFGLRDNHVFLINQGRGDLIWWFKQELSDPWFFGFNYRTEMQKIWSKTGLW